jgi:hypothetical protein
MKPFQLTKTPRGVLVYFDAELARRMFGRVPKGLFTGYLTPEGTSYVPDPSKPSPQAPVFTPREAVSLCHLLARYRMGAGDFVESYVDAPEGLIDEALS